jgi:hypothetical protein
MRGEVIPPPGFIAFATTEKARAETFLKNPAYDFLSGPAKQYIIENLNNGVRVQDPEMHPSPHLMIEGPNGREHYNTICKLAASTGRVLS